MRNWREVAKGACCLALVTAVVFCGPMTVFTVRESKTILLKGKPCKKLTFLCAMSPIQANRIRPSITGGQNPALQHSWCKSGKALDTTVQLFTYVDLWQQPTHNTAAEHAVKCFHVSLRLVNRSRGSSELSSAWSGNTGKLCTKWEMGLRTKMGS